jgi:peptidoglycan/xylan/chitin deacetylase (PgdA/CDA1 family)
MAKLIHALLVCSLLVACCFAQTPTLKVLPWNDHSAAVSLTFDDARPVHLDVAVPELNKRHLRGTFFVIIAKLTRLDDWRKVRLQGHEIGNHSVSHEHPANLSKEGEETQVEDAKRFLDSNFNADVTTFAYPYMETSPGVLYWVRKYDFAARGVPADEKMVYVTPDVEPDWYNLPSQVILTKYDAGIYKDWVDKAILLGAWTNLQFHGIGDPSTGWEPIPTTTFIYLLDYLKSEQAKGLWVAPFGEVAAYLRAQKVVERVQPKVTKGEMRFEWDVPTPFPRGVVLKVVADDVGHPRFFQEGHEVHASKRGVYSVSFDSSELIVRGEF